MRRSVSTLVAQSENAAFQEAACSIANTGLDSLKDAIHVILSPPQSADCPMCRHQQHKLTCPILPAANGQHH